MSSSPNNDFQIVNATLRDVWAVRRLEKAIFPKDAFPLIEIAALFLLPRIKTLKMIDAEGNLAAFLAVSQAFGGYPAWIITIGVAGRYQRQGVGRQLLKWIEDVLNPPRIRLTVRASNTPAITLYEQMEYKHIERRRRYYNDGEDGFVMEKQRFPHSTGE